MTHRATHRPVSVIVETIGPLPIEATIPRQTQMTLNLAFNRDRARNMITFLENELAKEHMELIVVEITGPTP